MKVAIVCDEFFSWGVYGGFGQFSRKLGGELVKQGVEVEAFVQKISPEQVDGEVIDGVKMHVMPRGKAAKMRERRLYETDADIIHSQSGMFDTFLAFRQNPKAKKVVTFQDPRTPAELRLTMEYEAAKGYPWYKKGWGYAVHELYADAVRSADFVATQAQSKSIFIQQKYGVKNVNWLPNMVDVGEYPTKSDAPSVLWLGRLDPIKRPEMFCLVSREFPDVRFFQLGKAHFGEHQDCPTCNRRGGDNLHYLGFDAGAKKEQLLSSSWILFNSSVYECLPVSFLEAAAHGCAILSSTNVDQFASSFGEYVKASDYWLNIHDIVDFEHGLKDLLKDDAWRAKGEMGYHFVKKHHDTPKVVQQHLDVYRRLTE